MTPARTDSQWAALSKNDWDDILELSRKKAYRRKFQIVEAFIHLGARQSFVGISYAAVARHCKISRQLVDHHFPEANQLYGLAFHYIYARLQKLCADSVVSRKGFLNQLRSYVHTMFDWIGTHPDDARLLVQFYAVVQAKTAFLEMQARSIRIGHDRLLALCRLGIAEGSLPRISDEDLSTRLDSVQRLIGGYILMLSMLPPTDDRKDDREELWRSTTAILGIQSAGRKA